MSAYLLAKAGWNVAILEQSTFPRRKVCGEFISASGLALLEQLGLAHAVDAEAGPAIDALGLFAGSTMLVAPMPAAAGGMPWGRALGRERLDTLLLERACAAGARLWQPWKAVAVERTQGGFICRARHTQTRQEQTIPARIVIAAHGSWEAGALPSQVPHRPSRDHDLLGFKAHFRQAALAPGLMPLLAFAGGYGGMVQSDRDRTSLSCCIRRDVLDQLRQPGEAAADAVLRHLRRSCRGVDLALQGAVLEENWLSAGPIRPGLRTTTDPGIFLVGNAAGEVHPVVAEGISIALQSAALLADLLQPERPRLNDCELLAELQIRYRRAWRSRFGRRLRVSTVVAMLAMRPWAVAALLPVFRRLPSLLTAGARLAGKAAAVR